MRATKPAGQGLRFVFPRITPMSTYSAKPSEIQKKWILIDAENMVVGRLASIIAMRLRGKHLPTFTPHMDMGDHVVVINAEKVRLTGDKLEKKTYFRHSGYMGGERFIKVKDVLASHPERVLELAVKGMMPKNNLGRLMQKKLRVYAGASHPHEAQQPQPLAFQANGEDRN